MEDYDNKIYQTKYIKQNISNKIYQTKYIKQWLAKELDLIQVLHQRCRRVFKGQCVI